ncbi:hypothetical protein WJX84_003217 [Apatococcus fuscideae]|uniref:Phospholipase B-like n=1 Tax=Apatococcus fuscideae TaxID=2026836 RepID=A0AAW1T789_9CHLO
MLAVSILPWIECARPSLAADLHPALTSDDTVFGSVVLSEGDEWSFQPGYVQGSVARGSFKDAVHTPSNFGKFHVKTFGNFKDTQQLYAAGYLEGYLTAARINDYHTNTFHYFTKDMNASLEKPMEWLKEQDKWLHEQIEENKGEPYWDYMDALLKQFDGMVDGYQQASRDANSPDLPLLQRQDFIFVINNGELYDIIEFFKPGALYDWEAMSGHELYQNVALQGRCTGLVTVASDLTNLFIGHASWDTFSSMTEIYKNYEFNLHNPQVKAQSLSMSSFPGELFSDGDIYLMSSGLVVVSTTLHIYNNSIYKDINPQAVVSWQRVRAASALAGSGEEYAEIMKKYNTGTYNNQYMVVDFNLYQPGKALAPGTLWVIDQVPGLVAAADMTETLTRGYWPSYNVPYFQEAYHKSGYPGFVARLQERGPDYLKAVNWMSYQLAPRAQIFRRDSSNVTDFESLKSVMRYNSYKDDPASQGDPIASICGRSDLDPKKPKPSGCFDGKVTDYYHAMRMEAEVVNGPTTYGGLPPFKWEGSFNSVVHQGHAEVFDFDYELQKPEMPRPSYMA